LLELPQVEGPEVAVVGELVPTPAAVRRALPVGRCLLHPMQRILPTVAATLEGGEEQGDWFPRLGGFG